MINPVPSPKMAPRVPVRKIVIIESIIINKEKQRQKILRTTANADFNGLIRIALSALIRFSSVCRVFSENTTTANIIKKNR